VSAAIIAVPLALQAASRHETALLHDLFWPDKLDPYMMFSLVFLGIVPVLLGYYHLGRLGFLLNVAVGFALAWVMAVCGIICFVRIGHYFGSVGVSTAVYATCVLLVYMLIARLHLKAARSESVHDAQRKLRLAPMRIQIFVCLLVIVWVMSTDVSIAQENGGNFNGAPESAKHALKRHGIVLTREALVSALRNPDAEVRELAAQVLAEDGEKEAIPSIVEALAAETVPANRVNIAFFLAQLGEETGSTALKRICDDFAISAWIRMLAAVNMRALHDDYCLASVVDVLQSSDDRGARMQALTLVTDFERPSEENAQKLLSLAVKALADKEAGVRMIASDTLGRLGNVAAIPALQTALANEDVDGCRLEMWRVIHQLQKKKEEHLR